MQKLQLPLVASRSERPRIDGDRRDQPRIVQHSREPAAAIMAVEQDRRVVIAFAIGPAAHVVTRRHRMPRAVAQRIQTTDDLAPIDGLHERHFIEHEHEHARRDRFPFGGSPARHALALQTTAGRKTSMSCAIRRINA
ncbi:hypothetical protein KDW36_15570 [Burkholderia dolosa]|uniref:hypothetical protein n=1 Tax=Burkholderia dolosa TaxID=152500 RepID=UPI001B8EA527|nr:hypothetical protein [Burkholderia dolosa]MBR8314602.1 hypothetical protein [Burkholderia dolosa]